MKIQILVANYSNFLRKFSKAIRTIKKIYLINFKLVIFMFHKRKTENM